MSETLKIAIAGLGTVGSGVIKILDEQAELIEKRCGRKIEVIAVSARDKTKDRGINLDGVKWYDSALELADDSHVDVIVELIGGDSGVAYDLCEKSIKAGKHFVTANKALIARHGQYFATISEENNVHLAYEAAVAGGIPIIKALKEGLAGNKISKVKGILNGTCNYILTAMKETGRDFAGILKEAQDLGYAEADPSFDVDGIDAAHKLAILASIAFGGKVDFGSVHIEGIRNISLVDVGYADTLGYKVKLLGVCEDINGEIQQTVSPCMIPSISPIAKVDGVVNAVMVDADAVDSVVLIGPGAGSGPTASSVVADIIDIAAKRFSYAFNMSAKNLKQQKFRNIDQRNGSYYIRIAVHDVPGVLANITDVLRNSGISMESILQKPAAKGGHVHIVGITHETSEAIINECIKRIKDIESVIDSPVTIRVEE